MLSLIDTKINRLERIGAILLLTGIVALVAVASVSRAVGSPIIWSVEIAQLLFVWLCMLCADLALQQRRHFGLALLSDSLGPRAKRGLDVANHLITAGFLIYLLIYAWRNAILMHPRLIGATQMHASYIHAAMVAGLALMVRTLLMQLAGLLRGDVAEGN